MKRLVAVGISIGVLAGLFTWFAFGVLTQIGDWKSPLAVWVGFAAWACFYAVGGGTKGLVTNLGSVSSGVVWGFLIVLVWKNVSVTSMPLLGLCVGIGAFLMCVQARVQLLSFIPGAFVGASAYFGFGGASGFAHGGYIFASVLVSVIGGSLLAFLSERRGRDREEARPGRWRPRRARRFARHPRALVSVPVRRASLPRCRHAVLWGDGVPFTCLESPRRNR